VCVCVYEPNLLLWIVQSSHMYGMHGGSVFSSACL